ncbi:MAG: hypothetical protein EON58_13505 [Alphaproteobacteria bacterium]|nr:MAG: hypothetical protein EON58_13505 [Alphaproteobacteria bacterium]
MSTNDINTNNTQTHASDESIKINAYGYDDQTDGFEADGYNTPVLIVRQDGRVELDFELNSTEHRDGVYRCYFDHGVTLRWIEDNEADILALARRWADGGIDGDEIRSFCLFCPHYGEVAEGLENPDLLVDAELVAKGKITTDAYLTKWSDTWGDDGDIQWYSVDRLLGLAKDRVEVAS